MGLVPSRLNSDRVPFKNIKELGGVPLINYTLKILNNIEEIDEIIVFASEPSISDYMIDNNLKYRFLQRPEFLDTQEAKIQDIIEEFLKLYDAEIIVLLHVTSPFLSSETISDCIEKVKSGDYDSAFTAYSIKKFAWFRGNTLNYSLGEATPRTQDIDPVIIEQSACYVFTKELFENTNRRIGGKPYVKIIDHFEGHDIDTPEDFEIAEIIVRSGLYQY